MINSDRPMPPLEGAEHRWVTVRGARLHIAESGSGEPVVLLHGFPQHWYAWRALAPLLAGDYRLICVDLRGADLGHLLVHNALRELMIRTAAPRAWTRTGSPSPKPCAPPGAA